MNDAASPLRSSAVVATGTLLSRITGVVRVWATAEALGITALADTYNSANSTPNIVYELILGGVLTATLVPLFVDEAGRDPATRHRGTSAVFSVASVALVALTGLAFAAAPWIARGLTIRVPDADRAAALALGTAFVRCFAPQVLGYGLTALAAAALQARRRFAAAAYAPVLNNVVVTAVLLTVARDEPSLHSLDGDTSRTLLLGLGTTAGVLVTAAALGPALVRAGVRLRWAFEPRHPVVRTMLRRSGWTVGYVAANQLALVFVMVLARDSAGALAAYQFAFVFFQLPHGLFAVSIMTAWLPELARHAGAGDLAALRDRFDTGLRALLVFVVPSAAGYLALSSPIVATLLPGGDAPGPARTAAALTGFALGLVPFSLYLYVLRAFYALGDTRTPFAINAFENGLNIAFAAPAYAWWGVRGLAGAYAAAYLLAAIVALAALYRRVGPTVSPRTAGLGLTCAAGAAASGGVAFLVARVFDGPAVALAAGAAAGALVYAMVVGALAGRELGALWRGRAGEKSATTVPACNDGHEPGS
jgi:putative peptidoglycan lipid II flippase